MKHLLLLLAALGACACERDGQEAAAPPPTADALAPQAPASQAASVVPRPKDQAQLDRMILAGYTPHSDHLHAPGVNECPMSKGMDAVM